jgi:hypothetical protein
MRIGLEPGFTLVQKLFVTGLLLCFAISSLLTAYCLEPL